MKPAQKPTPALSAQRGISLIEILVAIVLLSVGLLGLAGLQLRGMQVNQGSLWRAQAAIMAEDLADRMRADDADAKLMGTPGGFYGTFTGTAPASTVQTMQDWFGGFKLLPTGTATAASCGADAICQAAVAACAGVLPCVQVQSAAPGVPQPTPIRIAIYWNDARASSSAKETTQVGSYTMIASLSDAY